jgi:hypothetical protein
MYKRSKYTWWFPNFLPIYRYIYIYRTYFLQSRVTKVKSDINSVEVHPQLSSNTHPSSGWWCVHWWVLFHSGQFWPPLDFYVMCNWFWCPDSCTSHMRAWLGGATPKPVTYWVEIQWGQTKQEGHAAICGFFHFWYSVVSFNCNVKLMAENTDWKGVGEKGGGVVMFWNILWENCVCCN